MPKEKADPVVKTDKLSRQKALRKILERTDKNFSTQEALAKELRKNGFPDANQATVNRDLKELGYDKIGDRYVLNESKKLNVAKRELFEHLQLRKQAIYSSVSTFLITTEPGFAQSIATLLKKVYGEEILSTICSDDSILVIARDYEREESRKNIVNPLAVELKTLLQSEII